MRRPLSDYELAEESIGGMFRGSGTTANTFVYILWACLRGQTIVEKLKTELDAAIPHKDEILSYRRCQSLPYLQAVIDESLLLYPTIIATLPSVHFGTASAPCSVPRATCR